MSQKEKEYIFDAKNLMTSDDIHQIFAKELDYPEYYGKNLDALNDLLTDLSWLNTKKIKLVFKDPSYLLNYRSSSEGLIYTLLISEYESKLPVDNMRKFPDDPILEIEFKFEENDYEVREFVENIRKKASKNFKDFYENE